MLRSLSETENDFWAVGSGEEYALGAMAMGASAAQAVEVASQFDVYTGSVTENYVVVRWA